jgi:VWFA-related protein
MMLTSRAVAATIGALLFAASPGTDAQGQAGGSDTQQRPTFRSSAQLVEVDAIVLDKNGKFITGLKPEDLTVTENGKPQTIQQFYLVTYDPGRTAGAEGGAIVSPYADQADYRGHRVFVILFDEGSLSTDGLMRMKIGAEAFVHDQMGAEDAAGVMVNGELFKGKLTNDKGLLLAGIRAARPGLDTRDSLLAPFREWPRINTETEAQRISEGAREETAALAAAACKEDPGQCQGVGGQGDVENRIQQKARQYVSQARQLTEQTLQSIQLVSRSLEGIAGRKTLILLTEGFYAEDFRNILSKVAAQAARAGVTIYSIDGRGRVNTLSINPDVLHQSRARSTAFDTGDDGPNILTAGTGGFMVHGIDDMSLGFGRIVNDTSTYYVLAYQPANTNWDGKIRKIEVHANGAGAAVRARKSYAATKLPPQQAIWSVSK